MGQLGLCYNNLLNFTIYQYFAVKNYEYSYRAGIFGKIDDGISDSLIIHGDWLSW